LDLLKRAIERDAKTTYTCIREWTNWGSSQTVRVRRDQASTGANRTVVVAPISKQGTTIIDDGRQRVQYTPDEQELTIQDSPLRSMPRSDAHRRFRLVYRSYDIVAEGRDTIASRAAMRVLLKPKAREMGFSRRYWIDTEKAVLLKVEWIDPSGKRQVMSNTISISFPRTLPKNTFEKTFVGQPKEVHIRAPARHTDFRKLSGALGFSVVNPHEMPFGYLFIGGDSIRGRNRTMAALRYTDGAANVTIYQAKVATGRPPWQASSDMESAKVDNVWVSVDGDLPRAGKQALLAALKKSSASRGIELQSRVAQMFKTSEDLVEQLRSIGLDFDDVVTCVVAGGGNDPRSLKAGRYTLEGQSPAYIARSLGVDSSKIRDGLNRFWDVRQ
jgi:negative regulator of sigma E activity